MIIDAIVHEDGTLIAKVPESLHGKRIKITLLENKQSLQMWNEIAAILKESDALDIPKRSITEIIDNIRTFRES